MPNSLFLSLDGIDGAGKSTQCRLLADWLRQRGRQVVECADPGGTAVGQALRRLLLDQRQRISLRSEALLFMASRAQLVEEVIGPALAAGQTVLSDRFLLANVVYQGYGGGLPPDELWALGRLASGGVVPDFTIVLDLPLDQARLRQKVHADRLESRDGEFFERVRAGFLEEAGRHPERIAVVNAALPSDQVQAAIRALVAPLLNIMPSSR